MKKFDFHLYGSFQSDEEANNKSIFMIILKLLWLLGGLTVTVVINLQF